MKIKHWLLLAPTLMLTAMPSAYAGSGTESDLWEQFEEWVCRTYHVLCDKPPMPGSGPVSVPEPAMLALFTAGMLFVGVMMYRRARQRG